MIIQRHTGFIHRCSFHLSIKTQFPLTRGISWWWSPAGQHWNPAFVKCQRSPGFKGPPPPPPSLPPTLSTLRVFQSILRPLSNRNNNKGQRNKSLSGYTTVYLHAYTLSCQWHKLTSAPDLNGLSPDRYPVLLPSFMVIYPVIFV